MRTLLLACSLLLSSPLLSGWVAQSATVARIVPTATVYVCMSKGSVAYHSSKDCAGLNRCSHTVKAMTEQEAQGLGKRSCHKCY